MAKGRTVGKVATALLGGLMLLAALPTPTASTTGDALETLAGDACPVGAPVREYAVTSLPVPVSYNRWGDLDVRGQLYVLDADRDALLDEVGAKLLNAGIGRMGGDVIAMRDAFRAYDVAGAAAAAANLAAHAGDLSAETPRDRVDVTELARPLVLRAYVGECVRVVLTNVLPTPTSLHVHDVVAPAGAGAAVGVNAPDVTPAGTSRLYEMYIPPYPGMEGAHYLHSHADSRDQTRRGLFGALIAEPKGAIWLNEQGNDLAAGALNAIIAVDNAPDFREFVTIYHDEVELVDWKLTPLPTVSPYGEYGPGTKAINLRAEPFYDRFIYNDQEFGVNLTRAHDKSQSYGSYTYGDPGTTIPRSYLGDPAKIRLMNAGPGQYHIQHLHGGGIRWKATPAAEASQFADGMIKTGNQDASASQRLDTQNVGPGESFNLEPEGGSGGVQQSAGDFLFHCHIAEHYLAGMWSFWRVYNTLQPDLAPLPDRAGARQWAVSSAELVGRPLQGGVVLDASSIDAWVQSMLPPRGVPGEEDASVWDWSVQLDENGVPVYYGEPETERVWPNYPADAPGRLAPGERPVIGFDPLTGKLAYPLLKPHLGKRPPFAPDHGPTPYLKQEATPENPDGLCIPGARKLTYDMVAIEAPVRYNEFDTDDQGQVFVRAMDRAANQAPGAEPTSAVLRANAGDCVDLTFVNALSENEEGAISGVHTKSNIHTHLVQFDVQASDGVVAGFNFEQTVRSVDGSSRSTNEFDPSVATVTELAAPAAIGATSVDVEDISVFLDSTGAPKVGSLVGFGLGIASIEMAKLDGVIGGPTGAGTILLQTPLAKEHAAGEKLGYEFVRYRWYPDVELGTVYFHDHVNGLDTWRHGLFGSLVVEPRNSTWQLPTRASDDTDFANQDKSAAAVSHVVDILPGNGEESYCELVLHFQDRSCVSREAGDDCLSLALPLPPDRVKEPTGFNLRSEPLHRRNAEQPFLSGANYGADDEITPDVDETTIPQGDPATDMLQAYPGDKVVVRMLYAGQSASRGVGTFGITGHRFPIEQNLPGGRTVSAFSMAESTQSNLELECGAGGCLRLPGDYMYYMTQPEYLDRGAWGLLRVHDPAVQTPIAFLPGTTPTAGAMPTGVNVRYYDVAAVRSMITSNPSTASTWMADRFVLLQDSITAQAPGVVPPSPLVMRALPGEIIQVNLTNMLPGARVGMEASMLPSLTPGFALGRGADGTIGPGETTSYRWYADREVGVVDVVSLASVDDAARGLSAALVIEPAGSMWDDDVAEATTLHLPDGRDVREQVLLFASQDSQFQSSTMPYSPDVTGLTTVNFATEPLTRRVGVAVPSTQEFGGPTGMIGGSGVGTCQVDPDACLNMPFDIRNPFNTFATMGANPWTPVVEVARGEPLVLRVVGASGDQLQSIHLSGHVWAADPEMDDCRVDLMTCRSNLVSTVTVGAREVQNVWIPAAGPGGAGDYLYREHRDAFFESGAWGLVRVS